MNPSRHSIRFKKPTIISTRLAWAILLGAVLACSSLNLNLWGEDGNSPPALTMTADMAVLITNVAGSSAKLTEAAQNGVAEIPTATATPAFFTSARFYYFPDNAVFNGASDPGWLWDYCSPPNLQPNDTGSGFLTIGEFGAMTGQCVGDSPDKTLHRESVLVGTYDAFNAIVTFRVELRRIFTPYPGGTQTAVITFEGNALVVGNSAIGTGNFDFTCFAVGDLVYCGGEAKSLQLSGTMPFQIDFSP